jgi:TolB protein
VDHLQVVCDGDTVRELKLSEDRKSADAEGVLPVSRTGWCVLRALADKPEYPVLDLYPYATTSPVYVTVAGSKLQPKSEAAYFIAWIDRLTQAAEANHDWNTEAERSAVLKLLSYARGIYQQLETQ